MLTPRGGLGGKGGELDLEHLTFEIPMRYPR